MEYNELKERHERLKQYLFAVCAFTVPLSLAFFFHPRVQYKDLSHCGALRTAHYQLKNSTEPQEVAAYKALEPLVTACPEHDEDETGDDNRERPFFRGGN